MVAGFQDDVRCGDKGIRLKDPDKPGKRRQNRKAKDAQGSIEP